MKTWKNVRQLLITACFQASEKEQIGIFKQRISLKSLANVQCVLILNKNDFIGC